MTKRFGRSFAALALAVSMVAVSGCVVGGDEPPPPFPDNSMEINGTLVDITDVDVHYDADVRYVAFYDVFGDYIEFTFVGQGDPSYLVNELPYGDWSGFDSELVEVYVHLITGPTDATYTGSTPYAGWLSAGGSPPDVLTLDSAFSFSSGPIEGFQIAYSGGYDWLAVPP